MKQEETPFFTVVIPTYNRSDVIAATIASVLDQTFKDFELIVIDDGGTDDTDKIVATFEDERITYFKKENAERGAARNFGAIKAKGKYLNFLDSDDLLYMNHLEVAHHFIQQKQPKVFFQHYDLLVDQKTESVKMPRREMINDLLVKKGNILSCDGSFIEREVFLKHQFSEKRALSASEDYELWLRLAARYPIYYVQSTTSCIRFHDDRSVVNVQAKALIERKELMLTVIFSDKKFVEKYGHFKNSLHADTYSYVALHLCLAGHKKQGIQYLLKAFSYQWTIIFKKRFWATIKRSIF